MPSWPKFTPPDLYPYSEATRRGLYDLVVQVHFQEPSTRRDTDEFVPSYSPDEAGLMVVFLWNRWFAIWEQIEERDNPDLTPDYKRAVLRIEADPARPYGIAFSEV